MACCMHGLLHAWPVACMACCMHGLLHAWPVACMHACCMCKVAGDVCCCHSDVAVGEAALGGHVVNVGGVWRCCTSQMLSLSERKKLKMYACVPSLVKRCHHFLMPSITVATSLATLPRHPNPPTHTLSLLLVVLSHTVGGGIDGGWMDVIDGWAGRRMDGWMDGCGVGWMDG